jgi:hypothetical protein
MFPIKISNVTSNVYILYFYIIIIIITIIIILFLEYLIGKEINRRMETTHNNRLCNLWCSLNICDGGGRCVMRAVNVPSG